MSPRLYEFPPFRLFPETRELRRDGVGVALTPKAFDTLLVLVESRQRVVTKAELLSRLWPDKVVEEANLTQAVFAVRKALEDNADASRYIVTVPRVGYRFVAETVAPAAVSSTSVGPGRRRTTRWTMLAAAIAVAASLGALRFGPNSVAGGTGPAHDLSGIPVVERSIAVLPFENLSGDATQEYLADGMTEALIAELARFPALRVTSRTSSMQYKNASQPLPAIGQALGVATLVEGSVAFRDGRLRLTVQLIDAATDRHLFAETWDGATGDALGLQAEAARALAGRIGGALVHAYAPSSPSRPAAAAMDSYLKGRYEWNRRRPESLRLAIALFEEATRADPSFAAAWSGLAGAYVVLPNYGISPPRDAYARARAAAERALRLDREQADALAVLGYAAAQSDWDAVLAERKLRRAIELQPSHATARQWYAQLLSGVGRHDEAIEQIEDAQRLDPLSVVVQVNVGRLLYFARRYEEARAELWRAAARDPRFPWTHGILGLALARLGRAEAARQAVARLEALDGSGPSAPRAGVEAILGDQGLARETLSVLQTRAAHGQALGYWIATIHADLGECAPAASWLEKAGAERESMVVFAGVDPAFDRVRADARCGAALRRVGFAVTASPPAAVSK